MCESRSKRISVGRCLVRYMSSRKHWPIDVSPAWIFQKRSAFSLPRRFGGRDILISRHGFTFTPVCELRQHQEKKDDSRPLYFERVFSLPAKLSCRNLMMSPASTSTLS